VRVVRVEEDAHHIASVKAADRLVDLLRLAGHMDCLPRERVSIVLDSLSDRRGGYVNLEAGLDELLGHVGALLARQLDQVQRGSASHLVDHIDVVVSEHAHD
jgi:hypothetical protein